ncbi:MAG TPA: isoamylase early set domain-containing protein [Streptosporangiaceae bacterium]|jgi:hypothetical protein|nr:isoamylase early set domain-containing protein [Streptosporangiaceae bacterium]
MDHVITRRLAQFPSAAARPFVSFAGLFLSGLRLFRPSDPDQSATVTPDEAPAAQPWATAVAEEPGPGLTIEPASELTTESTCEPTIPTVPVTFTLPSEVGAGDVALCADFNGWTTGSIPLSRGSDGAWQVTVPLEPGNSYRYRYLLDGERWENAWHADRYEPNPFGSDDSVIIVDWPEFALQAA